jgi:DnaJ-domain-containing protein 1
VEQSAEVRDIKRAYYNAARDCHPDKFPGDEAMRSRFQEVAEAYQTLADPVRRQKYDLGGLAALGYLKTNATRLFGPPPWRVMIGKTDHWMWEPDRRQYTISIIAGAIPNGIAGVTIRSVCDAVEEAYQTRVAVLLDRVSEEQAKDTVADIEEFGLAVKAEPIEDEREGEQESPLQYFRRIQRELGMASESLRSSAIEVPLDFTTQENPDESFDKWVDTVKSLRSELRAAALGLEEFKLKQTGPAK